MRTATFLPLLVVGAAVVRQWSGEPTRWIGLSSLALLFTAGWYFHLFMKLRRTVWLLVSAATLNVSLALLWGELSWTDPQLFMIPLGLTILGLTQWFKRDLTSGWTDACRYAAALMILVSPVLQILQGSWWHLFSLMVLSVAVTLLAMILRVRVLIYTGVAFLFADLVAMVVRGSIDQPNVLWVAGVVFGLTVIALAAYCESHREQLQQRIRRLMAELQAWD